MLRRGFTLLEVLITILIIGLLATVTVYSYGAALARSHDQQRLTDLGTISSSLEQYYLDHKSYPKVTVTQGEIISANFQLDKTIQLYDGANRCANINGTTDSNFLTPSYLNSIPEDPQNKLVINANGGDCTSNARDGQYLYITNDNNTAPHSYLLMARMERPTNASSTIPQISIPTFSNYFAPGQLCDNTGGASCVSNYYLAPKNGQ